MDRISYLLVDVQIKFINLIWGNSIFNELIKTPFYFNNNLKILKIKKI